MTIQGNNIEYYLGGSSVILERNTQPVFRLSYCDADFIDTDTTPMTMGIKMSSKCCPVDFDEIWYAESNAQIATGKLHDGKLHYIETDDTILIFGELGLIQDIENSTFGSYKAIFEMLQTSGYQFLLRSWNFIPDINKFYDEKIENYQAFCKGRARAYADAGLQESQLSAATGIGTHSKIICGYFLASKQPNYRHLENALQRPAYEYPRRYGPKPPSFARATLFDGSLTESNTPTQFFLSGTASIRQSETMWHDDIAKQVQTMMENVGYLIGPENAQINGHATLMSLNDFDHFKVYFRHIVDYETIKDLLVNTWQVAPEKLFFMNVDICRSDLLVEIEGCINRLTLPVMGATGT